MKKPKVSVIMGIYNCEKTLPDAIESIIAQTYTNWELVMCDDSSADGTYRVAEEYKSKYPDKIKLLRNEKNQKLAATLNYCLAVATGEYVARMDADDESFPERLDKQAAFLDNHPEFHVVSCKSVVVDESGEREIIGIEGEKTKDYMLHGAPFVHPTIMMRKSVYDTVGGYTVLPRTVRGQDVDLWFKFYSKGYRGYILSEVLYKYYNLKSTLQKRKNFKLAWCYTKTNLVGFKMLGFPIYKYIYAFKPVISTFIPESLKVFYRKVKSR